MVTGNDHKRSQMDAGRLQTADQTQQGVHGRVSFYSSHKKIVVTKIFKGVVQCCIDRIGIMRCSMSHENKCLVFWDAAKSISQNLDDFTAVLLGSKQRDTESDPGKGI